MHHRVKTCNNFVVILTMKQIKLYKSDAAFFQQESSLYISADTGNIKASFL